ncbi:hypothetical protein [Listeria rustica]|uniref:Stage III sporulation protein AF n=1 Tax=Listeria rustica TaxID=2713503 RepID=A0A7W1T4T7_9LIST|nr:hypothetical protein [Listeria rustica]MBA3925526.1 hypothetical protein [Listeria rustica]
MSFIEGNLQLVMMILITVAFVCFCLDFSGHATASRRIGKLTCVVVVLFVLLYDPMLHLYNQYLQELKQMAPEIWRGIT